MRAGRAAAGHGRLPALLLRRGQRQRRAAQGQRAEARRALQAGRPRLLRAYANLANEMGEAGYTEAEAAAIKAEVDHYEKVREEVKLASGDYVDLKMYEPAMRHLLDTYIRAEESEKLSAFDDLTLVELIVERGEAAVDALPEGIRENREADGRDDREQRPPAHHRRDGRQPEVLREDVRAARRPDRAAQAGGPRLQGVPGEDRRADQAGEQARDSDLPIPRASTARHCVRCTTTWRVPRFQRCTSHPHHSAAAVHGSPEQLALALDRAIRQVKKADWRGNRFKEREVRNAIKSVAWRR